MRQPPPRPKPPRRPDWLAERAATIWDQVAEDLHPLGVLQDAHSHMLAVWCSSLATWIEASDHLEAEGEFGSTERGQRIRNPWGQVKREAESTLLRLAGEFGLTPSSLARLGYEETTPAVKIATRSRSA